MSAKDRVLLERAPHLVLDGALAAADAVGAREVVVARPARSAASARAWPSQRRSPSARRRAPGHASPAVPDAFLSGEETALVAAPRGPPAAPDAHAAAALRARPARAPDARAERRDARAPRADRPPRPGVVPRARDRRAPGLDARHARRLRRARPGVHEIALGTRLAELLDVAGGATEPVRAPCWSAATTAPGSTRDGRRGAARSTTTRSRAAGASLGAGVVVALPPLGLPGGRGRRASWAGWPRRPRASAGRACTGWRRSPASSPRSAAGRAPAATRCARLARWSGQVAGRGACHHPDGSVALPAQRAGASSSPSSSCTAASAPARAATRRPVLATPATRRLAA